MSEPDPTAARASLQMARAALESMTAASDPSGTLAADVSRPSGFGSSEPLTMAVRAEGAWIAARQVVRQMVGRDDLDGQALVAEVRRQEKLSLDDAHALVALHSWMERAVAPGSAAHSLNMAPTLAEQSVGNAALLALTHLVGVSAPDAIEAPPPFSRGARDVAPANAVFAPSASYAPPAATTTQTAAPTPPFLPSSPIVASAPSPTAVLASARVDEPLVTAAEPARSSSSAWIVLLLVILILGGSGGTWYWLSGRATRAAASAYNEGAAAYRRGALEVARQAFVRASAANPADAGPLIYLGRIARDGGDLAQSRRYLESAVRLAPDNELALRELGSAMLADDQPEFARRFYVRALERDPSDKLAQGFLGCALVRLSRLDEGKRWLDRAGQGDWTTCAADSTRSPR